MCNFKSGIILKNKTVIAEGESESHTDLLESLGIEDSYMGASKTFVRAELTPNNGEWWVSPEEHPEDWCFVVDQDIVPEWFDKGEYERIFRESVCAWWKIHILVDQKIEALTSGYYRLKRCEVKKLCNDVKVFLKNSNVGVMWENSNVGEMWGSSNVGEMWGSSNVGEMWGSSNVGEMRENSNVGVMWENSNVGEMRENSNVGVMWGNSNVGEMWGSSTARDFKNYPKIKVMVPADSFDRFEMIAFENKMEGSTDESKIE